MFWRLVYLPTRSEISSLQMETRKLQLETAELLRLQARHKNLADFVELEDERLNIAQEYLPAEIDDEKFAAELYRLAEEHSVSVNAVSVGEISEAQVQRQTVRIRLAADFVSLLNFIREILDGERLVCLENFSLASDGATNILDCELEILIYAANRKS